MQIISGKKLALRLRDNAVSSGEKFLYFVLIFPLFQALSFLEFAVPFEDLSALSRSTAEQVKFAMWGAMWTTVIVWGVSALGSYLCYRTNQKGDGIAFIERYMCLLFPISIQTFLIFCLFSVLMMVLVMLFPIWIPLFFQLSMFLNMLPIFYFYWRLNSAFKIVAQVETP